MQVKSLLRYPGGKSRAVNTLYEFIPKGETEICSPFFGGGSFEFHLINNGCSVSASDIFTPLVEFWNRAMTDPDGLADEVQKLLPLSKEKFKAIQKAHTEGVTGEGTENMVAAWFYALNRASFSGTTYSGGMSKGHPRFTQSSIDRLRNWRCNDLTVVNESFEEFIPKHSDKFHYLDPPYLIDSYLYGSKGDTHRGFNHDLLREVVDDLDGFIMSYNDCYAVRELYKDYKIIDLDWVYGMNASKKSSEVLIIK